MTAEHLQPGSRELISFQVGDHEFSVDIASVLEIRGWTAATPLPGAPPFVRGVINLRGAVMPVIDFGSRLGRALVEPTERHVIIVVKIGERTAGLLVDGVCETMTVMDADVQPAPTFGEESQGGLVTGFLPLDDRMITLVSLDRVFPRPEAEAA